jgi:hypothetical protein
VIVTERRTEGAVFGSALHGEYVHHSGTNQVYYVRKHVGGGLYDLKTVGRDEDVTADLNGGQWTFHPVPDMVVATTRDEHGNEQTSRMSARPGFCPPDMVERRARKRHWARYGTPYALTEVDPDWHWTSRSRG